MIRILIRPLGVLESVNIKFWKLVSRGPNCTEGGKKVALSHRGKHLSGSRIFAKIRPHFAGKSKCAKHAQFQQKVLNPLLDTRSMKVHEVEFSEECE